MVAAHYHQQISNQVQRRFTSIPGAITVSILSVGRVHTSAVGQNRLIHYPVFFTNMWLI